MNYRISRYCNLSLLTFTSLVIQSFTNNFLHAIAIPNQPIANTPNYYYNPPNRPQRLLASPSSKKVVTSVTQHQYVRSPTRETHYMPLSKKSLSTGFENVLSMARLKDGHVSGDGKINTSRGIYAQRGASSNIKEIPVHGIDNNSLNVKLPVPLGVTPLNIAPLPLQGGASYASLPRGVTSYGTTHPIR